MKSQEELVTPKDLAFKCKQKIAYNSNDYLHPKGTSTDNSTNSRFNYKVYNLYKNQFLKILDLGCSGGGFVRECMNDGCLAIGLEGSDFSKKMRRAEWAIIPEALFTCDITKEFSIIHKKTKKNLKFTLITAWEVLEHLEEDQLNGLIKNIKAHLNEGGLFIASVANYSDKIDGIEYHKIQKQRSWWIKKFKEEGLYVVPRLYPYFNGQYVRGSKKETKKSFHLIVSPNPLKVPKAPKLNFKQKLLDSWNLSKLQSIILR